MIASASLTKNRIWRWFGSSFKIIPSLEIGFTFSHLKPACWLDGQYFLWINPKDPLQSIIAPWPNSDSVNRCPCASGNQRNALIFIFWWVGLKYQGLWEGTSELTGTKSTVIIVWVLRRGTYREFLFHGKYWSIGNPICPSKLVIHKIWSWHRDPPNLFSN